MESNIFGSSATPEPLKQSVVLLDVSNICKDVVTIDCSKKLKEVKVVSQNSNAKGRGQGFTRNNKNTTQEAEINKETSPTICNVDDASAGNAIDLDKEYPVALSRKEIIFFF